MNPVFTKYFCINIYFNWKITHFRTTTDVGGLFVLILQEKFYKMQIRFLYTMVFFYVFSTGVLC